MSTRLYWTNSRSTANNMYRPVQSTYYWSMGRNSKYLREELNESDERVESSVSVQSDKSDKSSNYGGATCPRSTDASCPVSNYCSDRECPHCKCYNCTCNIEHTNDHGEHCSCPQCRDYNDYADHIANVADPERERTSTGIWIGNELRAYEQTDSATANSIEHITGIPTGVTI